MTTPAIIVGTGFLTPLFYEDPLTIPISYFQFLYNNTHLLTCLQTPHPLFLLTYLFGWINDCAIFCVILLNDFMDLHMSNLDTLVPEVPCCMQQGIMFTELWHIMRFFCSYSELISHIHREREHTEGPKAWNINIYINTTCFALTAAISILLNEQFNDIKNLLSMMSFFSKITHL